MKRPSWLPAWLGGQRGEVVQRTQPMDPADSYFSFNNVGYWAQPVTLGGSNQERIQGNFNGLVTDALMANPVIFAVESRRLNVFTEARFQFQRLDDGRPTDLHNSPATRLDILERPWTGGTTGQMLAKLMLHADFAGNGYAVRRSRQIKVARPDWMFHVIGTNDDAEGILLGDPNDLDSELIAYGYWPGGPQSGKDPIILMPDEVAHFMLFPDGTAQYRGASWLQPLVKELMGDQAAAEHKLQFFRNGATLATIVTLDKDLNPSAFQRFAAQLAGVTKGLENAYKTWFIGGGADVKVVGADIKQLDFTALQGKAETRIAAAGGVPPLIAGLSEGLQAASYHDYGPAKRAFVDGTVRPAWRELCGAVESIVTPPVDSRLWIDDRDIAYLRDDALDLAEIMSKKASILQMLINSGWKPDAAVDAVNAMDTKVLEGAHTGLFSVQLQPANSGTIGGLSPGAPPPGGPAALTGPGAPPPNALPPGGPPPTNGRRPALTGAAARSAELRALRGRG